MSVSRMFAAAACAVTVLLSSALALAADAGAGCRNSEECAPPTPYCRAGECIECLSNRNCDTGVCDVAAGKCRACLSDADCGGGKPYCDTAAGACLECLSNANCGDFGVQCVSGVCGTCGDGICGPREAIAVYADPGSNPALTSCPADCTSLCPTKDIGGVLGEWTVPTAGLRDLFSVGCSQGGSFGDAMFLWKAPKTGNYSFEAFSGPDGGTGYVSVAIMTGGCSGDMQGCSIGGFSQPAQAGQEIAIIAEATDLTATSITVRVSEGGACTGLFCPPPPPPDGADSGVKTGKDACMSRAEARGDTMCSGVECACGHCAQDYDDAAVVPGAKDVYACMTEKNCVGTDCYISGACRRVIDSNSGLSGAAFRAAASLQSCAISFECGLPCGEEAGVSSPPDGGVDAGRLCAPGRVVSCNCEDGAVGEKTCNASGSAFGACSCGAEPQKSKAGGGCSCDVGSRGNGPLGLASSVLALCVILGRRRGRSREEEKR